MTKNELAQIGINDWAQLQAKFSSPDILLGNGFSMNQSDKFGYNSLFDTFLRNCDPAYITLFQHFETTNFELILQYLNYAFKVNELLKLDTVQIKNVIEVLKKGLIQSVKEIHPHADEIDWNKISRITTELENFGNIYTTNYDLYLYHIVMYSNDFHIAYKKGVAPKHTPYQDYFWGKNNAPNGYLEFMGYQSDNVYKHIYYLHGALFIFKNGLIDLKIKRPDSGTELIDKVAEQIMAGNFPVFVTEGSAKDKVEAIDRNGYLRFCIAELTKSSKPLLVYGNSLSEVDSHIIAAIKKNPRPLIIAIYPGTKSDVVLQKEKYDILSRFNGYRPTIDFVDSSSIF